MIKIIHRLLPSEAAPSSKGVQNYKMKESWNCFQTRGNSCLHGFPPQNTSLPLPCPQSVPREFTIRPFPAWDGGNSEGILSRPLQLGEIPPLSSGKETFLAGRKTKGCRTRLFGSCFKSKFPTLLSYCWSLKPVNRDYGTTGRIKEKTTT